MADATIDPDAGQTLRVDLRLTPRASVDCPLADADADVDDAEINAASGDCTVDLLSADSGTVTRTSGAVAEDCFCRVFGELGCVPHVEAIEDGTLVLTAYVEDRSVVRKLVSALREHVGQVTLDRLAIDETPDRTTSTVDLTALTDKQREALELAVQRGYFEGEADFAAIAEDLDISKSALSQRLRAGQGKLLRSIFDAL